MMFREIGILYIEHYSNKILLWQRVAVEYIFHCLETTGPLNAGPLMICCKRL